MAAGSRGRAGRLYRQTPRNPSANPTDPTSGGGGAGPGGCAGLGGCEDVFGCETDDGRVHARQVAKGVHAMVVPGSGLVKMECEEEGLHLVLMEAGFDWREPGCSMCLAMNPDKLEPEQRCASTSNRNFEGRQ
eukprot:4774278-Pyramimonas_sp.AAC.1